MSVTGLDFLYQGICGLGTGYLTTGRVCALSVSAHQNHGLRGADSGSVAFFSVPWQAVVGPA